MPPPPSVITLKIAGKGADGVPFKFPRKVLEGSRYFAPRLLTYPGHDGWLQELSFDLGTFQILYEFLKTEKLPKLPYDKGGKTRVLVDVYVMAAKMDFSEFFDKLQAQMLPQLPTEPADQALFFDTMQAIYKDGTNWNKDRPSWKGFEAFREFFIKTTAKVLASDGAEPSPVVQQYLMKGGLMAVDIFRSRGAGGATKGVGASKDKGKGKAAG